MTPRHIAVIDIGKTNVKLALVDGQSLGEIEVVTRANEVVQQPPWPHFDTEGHWDFLLQALRRFHAAHRIDAISVTCHGASIVLIGTDGDLAAPILDYEHPGPDELHAAYDAIRPDFSETGSPRLAKGLNVGAQLFWQFHVDPGLKDRVRFAVTYPQYWGYRLTGVAATDVTSLGCHTDLWNPYRRQPSSLVEKLGIALAPTRKPGEQLGTVLPEIAEVTGLPPDTPVYCGIHDSNASLLPHLLENEPPFSVVSTGTWVIAMAIGGQKVMLDPTRDTLVNVNAFGDPVPSARFMGGREFDLAMEGHGNVPDQADIAAVLAAQTMLHPAVVPDTGPFQGFTAHWSGDAPALGSGRRAAAVGFYLALMTESCLDLIGHAGPVYVEGPFAQNDCFLTMLASATMTDVFAMPGATGTSQGAALLVTGLPSRAKPLDARKATPSPDLSAYANAWRKALPMAG